MNKQTAQLLEQHFDTAFAAPDGIAKLRELILTLAMPAWTGILQSKYRFA